MWLIPSFTQELDLRFALDIVLGFIVYASIFDWINICVVSVGPQLLDLGAWEAPERQGLFSVFVPPWNMTLWLTHYRYSSHLLVYSSHLALSSQGHQYSSFLDVLFGMYVLTLASLLFLRDVIVPSLGTCLCCLHPCAHHTSHFLDSLTSVLKHHFSRKVTLSVRACPTTGCPLQLTCVLVCWLCCWNVSYREPATLLLLCLSISVSPIISQGMTGIQ